MTDPGKPEAGEAKIGFTDGDGREWSFWRRHNAGINNSPEQARWLMYPATEAYLAIAGFAPASRAEEESARAEEWKDTADQRLRELTAASLLASQQRERAEAAEKRVAELEKASGHNNDDLECGCDACMLKSVRAGWRAGGKRIDELTSLLASERAGRELEREWLKRLDVCLGCGSLNCAHLWPQQKKCCPDCEHGAPRCSAGNPCLWCGGRHKHVAPDGCATPAPPSEAPRQGEGTYMVDQGSYDKGVYDAMHGQLPEPYSCGYPNCERCNAPSEAQGGKGETIELADLRNDLLDIAEGRDTRFRTPEGRLAKERVALLRSQPTPTGEAKDSRIRAQDTEDQTAAPTESSAMKEPTPGSAGPVVASVGAVGEVATAAEGEHGNQCLADIPFFRGGTPAGVDVCRLAKGHPGPHRTVLLPRPAETPPDSPPAGPFSEAKLKSAWDKAYALIVAEVGETEAAKLVTQGAAACARAVLGVTGGWTGEMPVDDPPAGDAGGERKCGRIWHAGIDERWACVGPQGHVGPCAEPPAAPGPVELRQAEAPLTRAELVAALRSAGEFMINGSRYPEPSLLKLADELARKTGGAKS